MRLPGRRRRRGNAPPGAGRGSLADGDFPASTLDGFPTREEFVERYFDITGRDLSPLGFWHTLSLWKVAIIADGVIDRRGNQRRNLGRFRG